MRSLIPNRIRSAWEWRIGRPWLLARSFTVSGSRRGALGRWGYLGYVGHRNYGDDALFDAITGQMMPGPDFEVADLPPFPRTLAARANALNDAVDLSRYTAMVVGGGTLIYRENYLDLAERSLKRGIPLLVAGTGVGDTEYWKAHLPDGVLDGAVRRWNDVLREAVLVGVRGPRSVAALHAMGIESATAIGDPALAVTMNVKLAPQRSEVIGINLGTHDPIWGEQARVDREMVTFARGVIERSKRVRFLAMSPIDVEIGKRLGAAIDSPAYEIAWDPRTIESEIAGCDVVIGQRLHSVILAFAYGVPSLSLSYQPKCLDFLESVGFPECSVKTDDVTAARLNAWLAEIDARWAETSRRIVEKVRGFQAVQKEFGERAITMVGARIHPR
jgi:polysaccharide pyruvyl transferase WcaK-like protein